MLFGPGKRVRVDDGSRFSFFDGGQVGTFNPEMRQLWTTTEEQGSPVTSIMLVGMFLGGVTLPVPAARDLGGRWWEHMYGADALLELRDPEVRNGRRCDVIAVQPQGTDSHVVWWIDQSSHSFVGFEVKGSNPQRPPDGIVRAEYKAIRFPRVIEDVRFGAQQPSDEIR